MIATTDHQKAARARWAAKRRRLIGYGMWQPFVPAEPVRAHLLRVREAGMPLRATAARLNLSEYALDYLMYGDVAHDPGKEVRRETAELVLAYWPTLNDFPDAARIDPTGTRRRVQALETQGFNYRVMAARVNIGPKNFGRALAGERVTAQLARAVAAMYDAWWNQRGEDHGVQQWAAERTRRQAAARGHYGPLAWDDDTIDDPRAVPQTDAAPAAPEAGEKAADRFLMGESVVLDPAGRRQVIAHLMEWSSLTPEQVGERLEMNAEAVSRSWERIKARARKEGQPVPWRRVFEQLRNKDLTREEMERAA